MSTDTDNPHATTAETSGGHTLVRGFRRAAVITIITSLSATALIGILVLLTGDFGEAQVRILLSALLVAAFSVVSLCDLALAGRALRVVAFTSIGVAVLALVLGFVIIWRSDWSGFDFGELLRAFAVAGVWAVSLAQANLLLLLAHRRHVLIRSGMLATVGVIVLVAVLLSLPIITAFTVPGEYWRVFGVAVILDALGTIVVPVLGLFVRDDVASRAVPNGAVRSGWVHLDDELAARVAVEASAAGATPDQVVAYAVRRHLDARQQSVSPRVPVA